MLAGLTVSIEGPARGSLPLPRGNGDLFFHVKLEGACFSLSMTRWSFARSEVSSLSSRLRGDVPRGNGALLFSYQEYLGVSSLLVPEDEVEGFLFPFASRGEDRASLVKF